MPRIDPAKDEAIKSQTDSFAEGFGGVLGTAAGYVVLWLVFIQFYDEARLTHDIGNLLVRIGQAMGAT